MKGDLHIDLQNKSDKETLLSLTVPDLAGAILVDLNNQHECPESFTPGHYTHEFTGGHAPFPDDTDLEKALMEALNWLQGQGYLAPGHTKNNGQPTLFITRTGRRIRNIKQFEDLRCIISLPEGLLHPAIAESSLSLLQQAKHDLAIFEAFKLIEAEVQKISGLEDFISGTDLMNKAFKAVNQNKENKTEKEPKIGPLTDPDLKYPEQEGMRSLFAGAFGFFRNRVAHGKEPKEPVFRDPKEAIEKIMLASHLMRILDRRKEALDKQQ